MPAKKIAIGNGYELRFEQRAKGQETPFWQGTIFKDGQQVGRFHNNGQGGMTIVHPQSVEDDFSKMVNLEAEKQGYNGGIPEAFNVVIEFAEMMGYERSMKNASVDEVWPIFMAEIVKEQKDVDNIIQGSIGRSRH